MVLTQVFGDLWLSNGMNLFGAVQVLTPDAVLNLVGYLLTSPSIVLGVITLVLSLEFYLGLKMSPSEFLKVGRQILLSPSILQGIGAQAIAFFAFLCLLSWADVSYVRPTTALTYAVSLLGARYILHEQVVPGRLMGSLVIGLGVVLVALYLMQRLRAAMDWANSWCGAIASNSIAFYKL